MKWTDEQSQAIYTNKCNLLVSAGAGSGKTAVLVERIVNKVINENVEIDELLIVTFTNAAADEMKERILKRLYEILEENPENVRVQEQIIKLNKAYIATIHSFCLSIIKDYYYETDIDPNFSIATQIDNDLMKLDVMEEIFEKESEQINEEYINLTQMYDSGLELDELKGIVLNIYKFIQNQPFPEEYVEIVLQEIENTNVNNFKDCIWGKYITDNLKYNIVKMTKKINEILNIVENDDKQTAFFINVKEKLNSIEENSDWDNIVYKINNFVFGTRPTTKGMDKENAQEIKIKWDKIKSIFKEILFNNTLDEIKEQKCIMKKSLIYLFNLVLKFKNEFSNKKRKHNLIDFNDLEHLALNMLLQKNENGEYLPTHIAKQYKGKFKEILIDEYQDSNSIQEYILNSISTIDENKPNIFMVGDVKQSIYKFRGARPELFLEKYNNYSSINEEKENKYLKINLYKNFRSMGNIINFTNYIFSNIMTEKIGELNYTENEYLRQGREYEQCKSNKDKIEINILNMNSESEEIIESDTEDEITKEKIEQEAIFVCNRIKDLINEKYQIVDKSTGEYRNAKYSDIVILLRSTKGVSEIFNDVFKQREVPIYIDNVLGYLNEEEVNNVISFLQIIDNPYQDIPLLAVLKSPFGNFEDNELVEIRQIDKYSNFYTSMEKMCSSTNESISKKVNDFLLKIDEYREQSKYKTVSQLIWDIYEEYKYMSYMNQYEDAENKKANLMLLLERAKQFESSIYKGLFNFINYILKMKNTNQDLGSATILGESANVVRIMSIHKSKGLEFPIVFLSNVNKKYNMCDLNNHILFNQQLGLGYDVIDLERRVCYSSIFKNVIKDKIKYETMSEEMRILYVAITRAKEKLIITGSSNNLEKEIEKAFVYDLDDLTSYMKIIVYCLFNNGYNKQYIEFNEIRFKDIEKKCITTLNTKTENNSEKVFDEEKYKKICNEFNFKYLYDNLSKIPHKISVSEIKRKNIEIESDTVYLYNSPIPKFMEKKEKNIDYMKIGTIYHYIMQNIAFNKRYTKEDIQNILNKYIEKNIFAKDEMKYIDVDKIYNFFNTDIYEKILNANAVYKEEPFIFQESIKELNSILEVDINREIENEKILVQGIIDLFFIENDEIILLDYKTDRNSDENEIKLRYNKQMEYYKKALEKIAKKKVKDTYVYLIDKSKLIKF